ncbi:MAG: hypothetical protein WA743_09490 [Pseudolabrys sp.]
MPNRQSDPIDVHVGHQVRARRLALGLSRSNLATGLRVTFQQVQKREGGANRMGASRLAQVAAILQVPVSRFLMRRRASQKSKPRFGRSALCIFGNSTAVGFDARVHKNQTGAAAPAHCADGGEAFRRLQVRGLATLDAMSFVDTVLTRLKFYRVSKIGPPPSH